MTENSASQDHRGTGPEWQQLEHFQSEHHKEQYLTALHSQKRSFVRLVACSVFRVQPWKPSGFPSRETWEFSNAAEEPSQSEIFAQNLWNELGSPPT
jgi:hypothetical protein